MLSKLQDELFEELNIRGEKSSSRPGSIEIQNIFQHRSAYWTRKTQNMTNGPPILTAITSISHKFYLFNLFCHPTILMSFLHLFIYGSQSLYFILSVRLFIVFVLTLLFVFYSKKKDKRKDFNIRVTKH